MSDPIRFRLILSHTQPKYNGGLSGDNLPKCFRGNVFILSAFSWGNFTNFSPETHPSNSHLISWLYSTRGGFTFFLGMGDGCGNCELNCSLIVNYKLPELVLISSRDCYLNVISNIWNWQLIERKMIQDELFSSLK